MLHAILISLKSSTSLTVAPIDESNTFSNLVEDELPLSTIDLLQVCSRTGSQFTRLF